ncbi:MAG: hypothetical protein GXZ19_10020 [Bacteroidales bacterium]|nr:hypothetical protein [Bacteroidales bacterium]
MSFISDWSQFIDRYGEDKLYTFEFLEKYIIDRIPADRIQDSYLWRKLVDIRKYELAYEILS